MQTFCAGGPGGQHQNAKQTGVRIIHKESGARGESRTERSQKQNKKAAFGRLVKSAAFMNWHRAKVLDMLNSATIAEKVAEEMKHVKVEQRNALTGEWEPAPNG